MAAHSTIKDVFGPGTFVDTKFIGVPSDARRLLKYLAGNTQGFTTDEGTLNDVEFSGDDLPIIPGPLKSQVLVSTVFLPPVLKYNLCLLACRRLFCTP